jgi:hypothetical protein
MKIWNSASIAAPLMLTGLAPAQAACYFSPYSFFPDRNDQVQIQVTTESGQSCAMAGGDPRPRPRAQGKSRVNSPQLAGRPGAGRGPGVVQ